MTIIEKLERIRDREGANIHAGDAEKILVVLANIGSTYESLRRSGTALVGAVEKLHAEPGDGH